MLNCSWWAAVWTSGIPQCASFPIKFIHMILQTHSHQFLKGLSFLFFDVGVQYCCQCLQYNRHVRWNLCVRSLIFCHDGPQGRANVWVKSFLCSLSSSPFHLLLLIGVGLANHEEPAHLEGVAVQHPLPGVLLLPGNHSVLSNFLIHPWISREFAAYF